MEYTNYPHMNPPDYNGALEYARKRLIGELLPILRYHNLHHSFGEVLPAALLLADQIGIVKGDLQLLQVAAAYHDIGWIVQGEGHEIISVEICKQSLPAFGFSGAQINRIAGMIMATRLPQSPHNILEKILADADMFTLGSDDYWPRNADLRYELEALGDAISDKEWYQSQLEFLQIHQYHTVVAQNERDLRKRAHIAELRLYVAQDGRWNGPTINPP
jgi:predicted metal-dependent HD superfamily phosphohydrolase